MTSIEYYNQKGDKYIESTLESDMSMHYIHFYPKLPANGKILDLGCGSGRDTKFFKELGFNVVALDGSEKMCRFAEQYTCGEVLCMDYKDMHFESEFDGIWACASLVHLQKEELPGIIQKISAAIKKDGIFYSSFKYGHGEAVVDGRYFSYYTESEIEQIIEPAGLYLMQTRETEAVRCLLR